MLKIGNEKGVHFEMNLSDDVMLKSYKINIHNNFEMCIRDSHETVDCCFYYIYSVDFSSRNLGNELPMDA